MSCRLGIRQSDHNHIDHDELHRTDSHSHPQIIMPDYRNDETEDDGDNGADIEVFPCPILEHIPLYIPQFEKEKSPSILPEILAISIWVKTMRIIPGNQNPDTPSIKGYRSRIKNSIRGLLVRLSSGTTVHLPSHGIYSYKYRVCPASPPCQRFPSTLSGMIRNVLT